MYEVIIPEPWRKDLLGVLTKSFSKGYTKDYRSYRMLQTSMENLSRENWPAFGRYALRIAIGSSIR